MNAEFVHELRWWTLEEIAASDAHFVPKDLGSLLTDLLREGPPEDSDRREHLMLFSADAWPGIADGSITVTFRAWTRPNAKTGGRYRIGGMLIEATDVREVAGQRDHGRRRTPRRRDQSSKRC